ncbi:hypothetical protein V6V47_29120 [Micromonospora sp. CPCC 205539]|uniref:hypothetical protein n=1 Tax=Micromonospora sp. CPCC 205539 TaxID=3122408 RepID=UPI002FF0389F
MAVYQPRKLSGRTAAAIITTAFVLWIGGVACGADSDTGSTPQANASTQSAAADPTDTPPDDAPTTAASVETSTTPAPAAQSTPGPQRTSSKPTQRPAAKPTTSKPKPKTTTTKPTPKPSTAKPKPPALPVVHPGAFCSKQGARGVTKTGKPMVCTTTATDEKKRWRAA